MENPVVVFVRQTHFGGERILTLPVGWTNNGMRLDGTGAIDGKECCVILLDDDAEIPGCDHINKQRNGLLPVVIHASSTRYTRDKVVCSVELCMWGKPDVRYTLSRGFRGIFEEIESLLDQPANASGFAKKCRGERDLEVLDQLAAICQILMIEPTALKSSEQSWYWFLNMLPESKLKDSLPNANESTDWNGALALITARANELAAELPG